MLQIVESVWTCVAWWLIAGGMTCVGWWLCCDEDGGER